MLIVMLTNDGTGTNESANYTAVVQVNKEVIWHGRLHGHNRNNGWVALLHELADAAAVDVTAIESQIERRYAE